jgi:hypothetical protein
MNKPTHWILRGHLFDVDRNYIGFGQSDSNGGSTHPCGSGRGADYAGADSGMGFGETLIHNGAGAGRSRRNAQS